MQQLNELLHGPFPTLNTQHVSLDTTTHMFLSLKEAQSGFDYTEDMLHAGSALKPCSIDLSSNTSSLESRLSQNIRDCIKAEYSNSAQLEEKFLGAEMNEWGMRGRYFSPTSVLCNTRLYQVELRSESFAHSQVLRCGSDLSSLIRLLVYLRASSIPKTQASIFYELL